MHRITELLRLLLVVFALHAEIGLACSTTAWAGSSGSSQALDIGDGSLPAIRYSGRCGLRVNVPTVGFVTDTSPAAEPSLLVRFYVYTGSTAGTQVVFRAHPGDLPSSGSVYDVIYDAANQRFTFLVGAASSSTAIGSAPRNSWIGVAIDYSSGGSLSAVTMHRGAIQNVMVTNIGVASVNAVSLGLVAAAGGGGGFMTFDAYDSRRTQSPGFLCRGDANSDGILSNNDVVQIRNERHRLGVAVGQPDCTHDGLVNVLDMVCVQRRIVDGGCIGNVIEGLPGAIFSDGFE